jgi:hypothetical protein
MCYVYDAEADAVVHHFVCFPCRTTLWAVSFAENAGKVNASNK